MIHHQQQPLLWRYIMLHMFSQLPISAGCEGDTANTPSYSASAVMGSKILSSLAWDFPIFAFWTCKTSAWALRVYVSVCGQSWGREGMLTPATHLHSPSWAPAAAQSKAVQGSLCCAPLFSVMLLRKGCPLTPSLACLMPLLSVFPCYSSLNKGDRLALPSCHLDIHTQGLHGQNKCLTAIFYLCCGKIIHGEVIPWLIAVV